MLESVRTRFFMSKLWWSKEELDNFLAEVKKDAADPKIGAYSPIWVDSFVQVIGLICE